MARSNVRGVHASATWFGRYHEVVYVAFAVIVAFVLRLGWIVAIPSTPISDFAMYQSYATAIFHHQDPAAITYQGAGYPFTLGMFYRLAGTSDIFAGKVLNVVLGTITVVLGFFIFRRLSANKFVVYAATVGLALLPSYVAYSSIIGTETLFIFLFALTLLLQLYHFDWRIRYPLLGLTVGAATVVKPYFIAYLVVIACTEWLTAKNIKRVLRITSVCGIFALIAISPATIWNYAHFHMFIFNSYNAGINLFLNSNSDNTTGAWMPIANIHISPQFRQELTAHHVNYPYVPQDQTFAPIEPLFRAEAEKWIVTHPTQYFELGVLRLDNTFFNGAWDVREWAMNGVTDQHIETSRGLKTLIDGANLALYVLSTAAFLYLLVGIKSILSRIRSVSKTNSLTEVVPTLNIGFIAAVFFATEGQPRYGIPTMLLSVFCLAYIAEALSRKVWANAAPGLLARPEPDNPLAVRAEGLVAGPVSMHDSKAGLPGDTDADDFWPSVLGGLRALRQANLWMASERLSRLVDHAEWGPALRLGTTLAGWDENTRQAFMRAVTSGLQSEPSRGPDLFRQATEYLLALYMETVGLHRRHRADSAPSALPGEPSEAERRCDSALADLHRHQVAYPNAITWQPISIVLPAYNEEAVIAATAAACLHAVSTHCPNAEIIIVDDGSQDTTGTVIDGLGSANASIVPMHNRPNRGYGGALRRGFDAARGQYIFLMDSDGQFDIDEIRILLLEAAKHEGTAVIGYRSKRSDPVMRRLNGWGWKQVTRATLGLRGIQDIDCAFKLLPAAAVRRCALESEGATISVELLLKLRRLAVPIVQVPVTHLPRDKGTATGASPKVVTRAVVELYRLRRKLQEWVPAADDSSYGRVSPVGGGDTMSSSPATESRGVPMPRGVPNGMPSGGERSGTERTRAQWDLADADLPVTAKVRVVKAQSGLAQTPNEG